MRFLVKLALSVLVIVAASQIARKFPTLAGLIATMPLTGLVVLLWVYSDNPGNDELMFNYTHGALWGILPSILFYVAALVCFSKHLSLPIVLSVSFGVWLAGAFVHQWLLR